VGARFGNAVTLLCPKGDVAEHTSARDMSDEWDSGALLIVRLFFVGGVNVSSSGEPRTEERCSSNASENEREAAFDNAEIGCVDEKAPDLEK
jgi:hypothetical protein